PHVHLPLLSFPTRRSSDLDQLSGKLLDNFPNYFPNIVHQKDLYFLTGVSGSNDTSPDFSVVQPYILADKAAAVTVHYQDEAGKVDRKSTRLNSSHVSISYA